MKGPVAAVIAAAARFPAEALARPVKVVVTADEETTGAGRCPVGDLQAGQHLAVAEQPGHRPGLRR